MKGRELRSERWVSRKQSSSCSKLNGDRSKFMYMDSAVLHVRCSGSIVCLLGRRTRKTSKSHLNWVMNFLGVPGSSAGKQYTCNAGDPDLIPGSGRLAGEGIGYPLQYSWAYLVTQTVKNPPAVQETWVWSLGWEHLLEDGMATHSNILAWRIPMDCV